MAPSLAPQESVLAGRERAVALGLAVVAGLAAVVVSTELFPYHSLNHDEGVYLNQAAMLLEGRLTIRPPVPAAFRPWFFVERPDGSMYPKYAPVPAAMFALGEVVGSPRFALGGVAAGVTGLTYAVVAELFDRRRGVLAATILLLSPLFLLQTAVFLPYAPTTFWNLLFAYAYLRADRLARGTAGPEARRGRNESVTADRLGVRGWAAVAGVAVGVAFFARPYTAVLFATPFVGHALFTLRAGSGRGRTVAGLFDGRALERQSITAVLGLVGVVVALWYNAALTGSPTRFPYQAFAPLDGIGFGYREILGYGREYTLELALRANTAVVAALFGRWIAGGPVGTLLALVGLAALGRRVVVERRVGSPGRVPATLRRAVSRLRRVLPVTAWDTANDRAADGRSPDRTLDGRAVTARRATLAATFLTVIAGNVAFWGNLNVLGTLGARDGLIAALGPYYHFDLLVPTAAFAADGTVRVARGVRDRLGNSLSADSARLGRVLLVGILVVGVLVPSAGYAAAPIERNADVTRTYDSAYAVDPPADAVVFLPTPLGDWLAHPYQVFRNDPTYDEGTVYALPERQFAVSEAFPDRRLYRYVYRGPWRPLAGTRVTPHLQRVRVREGSAVRLGLDLRIPRAAETVSIRVSDADDAATFAWNGSASLADDRTLPLRLTVRSGANGSAGLATLDGRITRVGGDELRLTGRTAVTVRVFVDYGTGAGLTYRVVLPVRVGEEVRALTPELEACERPQLCGGEAAYVPGESPGAMDARLTVAHNASAVTGTVETLTDAPPNSGRDANGGRATPVGDASGRERRAVRW